MRTRPTGWRRPSPFWWRLLTMPVILLAISFIAFLLVHLAPSDPAEVSLRLNAVVPTDEAIALVRQELGLDQPFLARYGHWLHQVLQLDFGRSFLTATPNYWIALLLIWGLAVRLIRGTMLTQFHQPYVFYARARGLPEKTILLKHVLRNSLHAALTGLGMSIPKLIAGTVVIESIFAWPGIGSLGIQAVFGRDYPVIQAYILLMAVLFLMFNFLVDCLQQALDPRVRSV